MLIKRAILSCHGYIKLLHGICNWELQCTNCIISNLISKQCERSIRRDQQKRVQVIKPNYFSFFQSSSSLSEPEYYRTCDMYIRRQFIKNKIVIFTAKTMMWMFTHQQAPPWTVQVWEHLFSTAGKLFHVRIAEGKYAFWWLYILENGIWNRWSWPLVVLVVAGVRYICDGMAIRWTFEKSGVFCWCLIDWCWASLMGSQIWCIKLSKIFLEINMNYM